MAEKNEGKKMEETKKNETVYEIQTVTQKQTVLDLDKMEDVEIQVVTKNIIFKNGVSTDEQLKVLSHLVSPKEKQVIALSKYFTSESYQDSKKSTLDKGNYMTASLRSQITNIMGGFAAFADVKASERFNRWLEGYKKKVPSAVKLLATATATLKEDELSEGL